MTLETLVQLARSRTPADRSRVQLATAALALSGALLIGALRIARLGKGELGNDIYSNYIAESGLRSGLIAILIILAALTGGLAVQALRLGTAARERRLTALRLAGASRKQLRQLTVADAAIAGLAGGLLAGPAYLVLSLLFGTLPRMARILPGAEPIDALLWIPVVVMTTAAGAVIGGLLHRDGTAAPQPQSATQRRTGIVAGPVLVALGLLTSPYMGYVGSTIALAGTALLFLSTSGLWIRWLGRRLQRSGDPANLLTGVRLMTDSRPSSRICMLLGSCGFLVGSMANGIASVVADQTTISATSATSASFYTTGFGLTIAGLVLIVLTAMAALIVGVADQLVDQRRQLASLTALGVDLPFLRRVIRRQLTVVAAPALAAGLLFGTVIGINRVSGGAVGPFDPGTLLLAAILTAAGWLLGHLGGAAAGLLLRNQLRDALDPENLRAA
ncbi:FtsX-like permease family protein [Kribbella sp. NPDC003505]|uniref:FtsX-like permease family protein n=1 Tax=Kribbella sp. NPDC003505 TaxID=3154448 RepID=UPI0033AE8C15